MTPQREPILIWGAGAIGGVLGAYWTRAGLPVQMVDIVAEHATACSTSPPLLRAATTVFKSSTPFLANTCYRPSLLHCRYLHLQIAGSGIHLNNNLRTCAHTNS